MKCVQSVNFYLFENRPFSLTASKSVVSILLQKIILCNLGRTFSGYSYLVISILIRKITFFVILVTKYTISATERKKIVSRRADEERRISSFFILAPRYVVRHPHAEIRGSSSSLRDTFFFLSAVDFVSPRFSKKLKNFTSIDSKTDH